MTEQRRMEYLDALGIEQFVPRKQLPGAKPSLALIRSEGPAASMPSPQAQPLPAKPGPQEPAPPEPVKA
ncbi:MAG TPA: hypothetical protein PKE57_10605, partial [Cellvibrionaceae bacterium]|nr:hypothetical protein [Cellvibrionaceae bacterium]